MRPASERTAHSTPTSEAAATKAPAGCAHQAGGTSTSYVVVPTTKMWFGNPNSSTCTVKISINGVTTTFTLAPGQVKEIKIYDDCSYVGPFAC